MLLYSYIINIVTTNLQKYLYKYFANTLFMGKQVIYLPTCHSTNDMAVKLVPENELFEGAVIITDDQTSGRGQRGNTWEAAPGKNLTFSIYLKPSFLAIEDQFYLNIITSLGLCDFLNGYISDGIAIKWPNDIYFRDNKIGGILIENSIRKGGIEYSIIGIGLNVNQTSFSSPIATSMALICNQEFELNTFLQELLLSLEIQYLKLKRGELKKLLNAYLDKLYWKGERHIFMTNGKYFEGEICGIDEIGRLLITTEDQIRAFHIKEITFVNNN